jgi:hypothetical protein
MTFPQLAAYEMEGIRIADRVRIRRRHVVTALGLGLVLGLVLGMGIHIATAYDYGWNIIDGGTTDGGYRTLQARWSYEQLQTRATSAVPM